MFRPNPKMPAEHMRTYRVTAPAQTHFRPATCVEAGCEANANGWETTVDVGTELGAKQANYIRLHSHRAFTYVEAGTLVTFTFPAGQTCFAEHRVPLEREPFYVVRDGDWRGNPTGRSRRHVRADDWVDEFATNQQNLHDIIERG